MRTATGLALDRVDSAAEALSYFAYLFTQSLAVLSKDLRSVPKFSILNSLLVCSVVLTVLELLRNPQLDRIIRLRRLKNDPHQPQHIHNLVWRLPLVRAQHAQAHRPTLVVGDVRVVDLGAERERRGLEGVFFGESDLDVEFAALRSMLELRMWLIGDKSLRARTA